MSSERARRKEHSRDLLAQGDHLREAQKPFFQPPELLPKV